MQHLRARIDELTTANEHLRQENSAVSTERDQYKQQTSVAEGDLIAVRASLRRMIRDHTDQMDAQ
ncbi:hypothetical protein [Rhodococcus sp. KBS0724]|uniref:hypothetical protein n=1 Tax=Rhodococcus sp. KBS0724 TaxID=1179674 RepID=UPI00163DCB87|nr:hypothetical protein [Rhodococcus sp. KBS0724]